MPRFFIDTADSEFLSEDDTGYDYADVATAKQAAVEALPDMARDKLPDGGARTFEAIIRDNQGKQLMRATLSLKVVTLVDDFEPTN